MDLCILYGTESTEHDRFIDRAETYFDSVMAVPVDGMRLVFDDGVAARYKQTDITAFDAAFLRVFDEDILFGEHLPGLLAENGVYTQADADSLSIATNKFYSMKVLAEGGMTVPQSSYLLSTDETERAAAEYGYPVVLKLISGYGGRGVMRASNPSDLGPIVDAITLFEQDICLQQYVENPGEDIRVIVIGDQTFAYKRVAEDEQEWRSNVSQGAIREAYELSEELEEVALRAARLAGFDICGVDIIAPDDEPHIVELNMSPGVPEELEELFGVDVIDAMMAYMHDQVRSQEAAQGL